MTKPVAQTVEFVQTGQSAPRDYAFFKGKDRVAATRVKLLGKWRSLWTHND